MNQWTKWVTTGVVRIYRMVFHIVALLPARRKLIVFESFFGRQYSCNPRALYEYMQDEHPEYTMIWSADPHYASLFEERNVRYVKRFTIRWVWLMALAGYWVTNVRLPLWMKKPKHTVYLQTWHGTPLKKLGADIREVHMPGTNTENYRNNFRKESSRWDYLVSPNAYSSEIFERAFHYDRDAIIESGYPRNDRLHQLNNEAAIRDLKEKCGVPLDKKVVLYAPTWRDDEFYEKGRYKFNVPLNLADMQEQLGDEFVILLRMHYLIADRLDLKAYKGFAYDFSNYEDITDLYLISDALITDYSSVFFDYANLKRPILFFAYDLDRYRDKLRGFYFDLENEAPGPIVNTSEQVIEKLKEMAALGFTVSERFNDFYQKFCYLESGVSSKRVADRIFTEREKL